MTPVKVPSKNPGSWQNPTRFVLNRDPSDPLQRRVTLSYYHGETFLYAEERTLEVSHAQIQSQGR